MKMVKIFQGYEVKKEEDLEELKSFGMVLEHKKSGARVIVVSNEDENKVFSIGFRTPPSDSTGVAHIVEHTVLCGSRQFPAKDPFVELAKGSLNTFLNAMTYSDKTIYPIASCNEKDFQNLMHVYLDAVFYPNIYQKEEIFKQEGWHYELENPNGEITYNGVVYNEMKGVFSSPEQQLFRCIQQSLFPDTTYGMESGGTPECIPDLTYEEFLEFHKKYYHPSNSYIYLYGDMDVKEKLDWIDQNYLNHFSRISVDSEIKMQKPFTSVRELTDYYSITEEEEVEGKTYLSYNVVIEDSLNSELYIAFQILDYVLLSAPGAPLKQALLDAGIGSDILSSYDNGILQPVFSMIAKNTEENQKESFVKVIRDTLEDLAERGLDEKSLQAAINSLLFKQKEGDFGPYPKGLMYGIQILDSWLYDDEKPFIHICPDKTFTFLREQVKTGYYEELIKKYFLENTHGTIVMIKPKRGYTAKIEEKIKEHFNQFKSGLSKEEINKLVEDTKKLHQYQEEPSTEEDLKKIPMLDREDIGKRAQSLYNAEHKMQDVRVLQHKIETYGIGYLRLAFLSNNMIEYVPYLSLLTNVLGYMDTEKYSFLEYTNEVNIHTGGISSAIRIYNEKEQVDHVKMYFELRTKYFYGKSKKAVELLEEMIFHTKLDDEKRFKEIVGEIKSKLQMKLNSAGHGIAISRVLGYDSISGLLNDQADGIGFYRFIDDLDTHFEEKKKKVIETFQFLMKNIFQKGQLLIDFTGKEDGYQELEEAMPSVLTNLYTKEEERKEPIALKVEAFNEGFKTSGQVQYVARAGNFKKNGNGLKLEYTGALRVLRSILSYDYLWNHIRVKGGAYGCMCGFSRDGKGYMVSYRDPNLRETNMIYDKTREYVRNFTVSERDMVKYIIGTISTLDTPLNPFAKGNQSFLCYVTGITQEDLQKERDEILNTTQERIRSLENIVGAVLDAGLICVIGNERKIEENKDLFKTITSLM